MSRRLVGLFQHCYAVPTKGKHPAGGQANDAGTHNNAVKVRRGGHGGILARAASFAAFMVLRTILMCIIMQALEEEPE